MRRKTDLRVLRTKTNIRKAFYELMKEKKFNKITVQDIADRAFINRNTFYLHYLDKDDLLEKISDECFDKMRTKMDLFDEIVSIENVREGNLYELSCMSFAALLEDIEFYEMIFIGEGIPNLILEFTKLLKEHMISFGADDIRFVYVEFISSALIGMMRYWIQNRDKYSVEEISRLLINMYTQNIIDLLAGQS